MSHPGRPASSKTLILAVLLVVASASAQDREHDGARTKGPAAAPGASDEASLALERANDLAAGGSVRAAYGFLLDRGRAWLGSGRVEDAIAVSNAATGLQPEAAEGWALLGRAHTRNRDFGSAQKALATAVDRGDTSTGTLVFLGSVQWENGDLRAAERTYRRAIEGGERPGLALAQLGRLELWEGRYPEAAETLDRALSLGSAAPDLLFDRAEALRGAGRFEEAIDAYRRVNLVAPTLFKAYYGLAVVLARAGRTEESSREFARYEEFYREDQERTRLEERGKGEIERARSLVRDGEIDAALAHLANQPQSVDVLTLTSQAHTLAGRKADALAALERAVSLDPGRADLRRLLNEIRLMPSGDRE